MGLDYTSPSWQVQAEAGVSRWQVDGAAAVNDRARRLAVTWQGETVSVQGGHHDVGAAYAALSADVVPGARETYLNSGWRATDRVQLAAGVRRAKNSLLEGTENLNQGNLPHRVDQLDASAMVDMSAVATGLQLQANVHEGMGENFNNSDVRTRTRGVNLSYPVGQFTTSLGLQHNRFENGATPLQDATAKLLSTGLGWSNAMVEDAVWRWNVFGQYNLQHQRFDAGGIQLQFAHFDHAARGLGQTVPQTAAECDLTVSRSEYVRYRAGGDGDPPDQALDDHRVAVALKVKAPVFDHRLNPDLRGAALHLGGGDLQCVFHRGKGFAEFDDMAVAVFPVIQEFKGVGEVFECGGGHRVLLFPHQVMRGGAKVQCRDRLFKPGGIGYPRGEIWG